MNQLDVIKTMAAIIGMGEKIDSSLIRVAMDTLEKTLRMLNKDITEASAASAGIIT